MEAVIKIAKVELDEIMQEYWDGNFEEIICQILSDGGIEVAEWACTNNTEGSITFTGEV
jgi:hypothetical protein